LTTKKEIGMKNYFLNIFIVFLSASLSAQKSDSMQFRRNVIAISPSKATHINGVMLNFWENDEDEKNAKFLKINGIELNFCPLIFTFPMFLVHGLVDKNSKRPYDDSLDSIKLNKYKIINGVHIGLANIAPANINGFALNGLGLFQSKINGVLISPLMNKNYIVKGITIGLIGNHDVKCNGVQIGLFNSCTDLHGIQIGLFNKNQKRKLPFINWNFKKTKNT
jgi:hypothetical protein